MNTRANQSQPNTDSPKAAVRSSRVALLASVGSVAATLVTGAVCAVPMLAILAGIGGLGFLTQYAHLRLPASAATLLMLSVGFYYCYFRPECSKPHAQQQRRFSRRLLWLATALAVSVNAFEYVVLPALA